MPQRKVGLVGCGTIGSELARAIDSGKIPNAILTSVFDVVAGNATALKSKLLTPPQAYSEFSEFLESDIDIVVEAASQRAVSSFAKLIVASQKDLMIMSVGALADNVFMIDLMTEAHKKGSSIYIPSGAIAGIDAIRSVKHLIETVSLTTTKNPNALAGAPFFEGKGATRPEDIKERTMIYSGPASEAVKLFPANVNVAAVLSLAGVGPEKTLVRIIADPSARTNKHEISATGSFGEIQISVNNVPSPGNPKTSFLAVLSAIECLRSVCDDSLRVGS